MRRWLAAFAVLAALGAPWTPSPAQAPAPPAAPAKTDPWQAPLLNPPRPPVKPNLMITLDDSASMGLPYMPESLFQVDGWVVYSPANANAIGFDPDDILPRNMRTTDGTFIADPDSRSWQQRFMRSPETNTLYYNPEVRYRPWLKADGSRFPAANIHRAALDPMLPDSVDWVTLDGVPTTPPPAAPAPGDPPPAPRLTTKVDLSKTVENREAKWCVQAIGGDVTALCPDYPRKYVPGLYFRLKRRPDGKLANPQQQDNYLVFDANSPDGAPRGPDRSDCLGPTRCTQAEEQQNFANWFVYYRSRLHLAKAVLAETLGEIKDQARIGYGRLGILIRRVVDGTSALSTIESGVRDFDSARKAEMFDWLFNLRYATGTPLGRAMQDVGQYYQITDSRGPWGDTPGTASTARQASCRAAYHLLITDGYWTGSASPSVGNADAMDGPEIPLADGSTWRYIATPPYKDKNTNYLADVAMSFWNQDLRPDLPNNVPPRPGNEATWQSMTNFIVGMGVKGTLDPATDLPALTSGTKTWGTDKIDDLWHSALNSRGAYFSAVNVQAMLASLRKVLSNFSLVDRVQAGVAIGSPETVDGNSKYLAVYRSSDWSGDLQAYALGGAGLRRWSAEQSLPPWQERRIFIRDEAAAPAKVVPFDQDKISVGLKGLLGISASGTGTGATPETDNGLVAYLRGDRSREGYGGFRQRSSLLGDFIHSTPVPSSRSGDPDRARLPDIGGSYDAFVKGTKMTRPRAVYAGANDGMLHVFRDEAGANGEVAGQEVFAYIPHAVASQLPLLARQFYEISSHRYFVDGPLVETDVFVPPPEGGAASWRSYLLGTTGAGPAAVFALDVTDAGALDARSARWEIQAGTDSRLGHVLAPVAAGQLPNGRWVALFGNGYGSADGKAYLYVVDIASGQVQTVALAAADSAPNGLGGVALRKSDKGQIVAVYAGDLTGRLWRLDFSDTAPGFFTVAFGGQPLFQALPMQPIVQAPLLQVRADRTLVAVGTGILLTLDDASDRTVQAVYQIEDRAGDVLPRPIRPDRLTPWKLEPYAATGKAQGPVLYSVQRESEKETVDPRGWWVSLSGTDVPVGLRVLQPLQAVKSQFLVGAEAPPLRSVPSGVDDPCSDAFVGKGVNLLLSFSSSPVPKVPVFDTNADGVINSSDAVGVVGYGTAADGEDAIFFGNLVQAPAPPGGGGGCTRTVGLVGAGSTMTACPPEQGPLELKDRVWRRILTPPF